MQLLKLEYEFYAGRVVAFLEELPSIGVLQGLEILNDSSLLKHAIHVTFVLSVLCLTRFALCRHHQQGRWQARIGRVAGNKDLYLGTFGKQFTLKIIIRFV